MDSIRSTLIITHEHLFLHLMEVETSISISSDHCILTVGIPPITQSVVERKKIALSMACLYLIMLYLLFILKKLNELKFDLLCSF